MFFSDGKHVYRIWYTISNHETGLQVVRSIVESFKFSSLSTIQPDIPDSVWNEASLLVDKSGTSPMNTCCGLSSGSNPFGCCDDTGNCVWYVYYRYGYVPFRYNATTWWGQVPDYPGWMRSTTSPRWYSRNIAWWEKPTGMGHVGFIQYYTGDLNIMEMLWCASCERQRPGGLPLADGYIYERPGPTPNAITPRPTKDK